MDTTFSTFILLTIVGLPLTGALICFCLAVREAHRLNKANKEVNE